MTDLEALVVAAYVFADEYSVPARSGRPPLTSDAELVALAVAQAAIGISSDRQFLGLVERVLPGWFPHLPDQSQYNRRLRALVELISIVQQQLARWLDAGGVRLVLLTDERGLPLGYTIVPANEKEYEPLADLLTGTPAEVVIADKGLWGRGYQARLAADNVRLLTPDRTRTAANIGRERALASLRLVIESVALALGERRERGRALLRGRERRREPFEQPLGDGGREQRLALRHDADR